MSYLCFTCVTALLVLNHSLIQRMNTDFKLDVIERYQIYHLLISASEQKTELKSNFYLG